MLRPIFVAGCMLSIAGCGGAGFKFAPVSGQVTMDGKPLPNVHVTFMPLGTTDSDVVGPGSHDLTDADGRFQLRTTTGIPGAVVGNHRISIEAAQEGETGQQSDGAVSQESFQKRMEKVKSIPARYNRESKLNFDVPESGTSNARIELTSS